MLSEECSKGMIIPIYKKGDVHSPSNYRPITLLSSIGKLFTKIMCKRLIEWATDQYIFSEAQFGFRPSYSTTDASYTLQVLLSRRKNKQKIYCAFVDFSTAFDSVNRQMLYSQLKEYGISSKMLQIIIALYNNVSSCIKIDDMCSDMFSCNEGLRQGYSLSPILFSFYINDLVVYRRVMIVMTLIFYCTLTI